jgi:hypothetical protein
MREPKRSQIVWGVISSATGAIIGILAVRSSYFVISGGRPDSWWFMNIVLLLATAVFFMWLGNRSHARGTGELVSPPALRWGRLLLGLWLVFNSRRPPSLNDPRVLKPDNETQAVAMVVTSWVITGVGLLLVAMAFHKKKSKAEDMSDRG